MNPIISLPTCQYVFSSLVELIGPLAVTADDLFNFMAEKRQHMLTVRRVERAISWNIT